MNTIYTQASIKALRRGWQKLANQDALVCIFCGEQFPRQQIYRQGEQLVTAKAAVRDHISRSHGSVFSALTANSGKQAGLSEVQYAVLAGMAAGQDDKAIAERLENRALSTVRVHRRNLRLRYEEAKLFVAAMELAMKQAHSEQQTVDYGPALPVQDDRARIDQAEADGIEARFFRPDGSLVRIPPKEKAKLVVLKRLQTLFQPGRSYSDAEVRDLLAKVHEDHALLRRYLVDYRFIHRSDDGRAYWL